MFLDPIFDLIFPEKCSSCQRNLVKLGKPLCGACLERVEPIRPEKRCGKCGGLTAGLALANKEKTNTGVGNSGGKSGKTSCICSERHFFFHRSYFLWLYDREGRKLLTQAKMKERVSAVKYIKNSIPGKIWETLEKAEKSVLLLLPSSHVFIKKIAAFLAHESNLPLYEIFSKKSKKLQSKLMHEKERFLQIEKNLQIDPEKLKKLREKQPSISRFILVDDVWTSGATMNFAAKLLSEEGVDTQKISVLALFRRDKKN